MCYCQQEAPPWFSLKRLPFPYLAIRTQFQLEVKENRVFFNFFRTLLPPSCRPLEKHRVLVFLMLSTLPPPANRFDRAPLHLFMKCVKGGHPMYKQDSPSSVAQFPVAEQTCPLFHFFLFQLEAVIGYVLSRAPSMGTDQTSSPILSYPLEILDAC